MISSTATAAYAFSRLPAAEMNMQMQLAWTKVRRDVVCGVETDKR